ncbi:MAG: hypothetical protein ACRDSN_08605, partial [Pseudonocardiaceae bacterium]
RIWQPRDEPLDQGSEGACVAFALSAELAAAPWRHTVSNESSVALYQRVRAEDRRMGNYWYSGASVLAGMRVARREGLIRSYWWAFGVEDVVETILRHGPVILGVPWYSNMYGTGPGGLVEVEGTLVGGHAIMAHGFWPDHHDHGDVVVWTNSWGAGYGLDGVGYIRTGDLDALLANWGEACVPADSPVPA